MAALGVVLMASASVLGAILVHDGAVAPSSDLNAASPGQSVAVKGDPWPFTPGSPLRAWRAVLPILGTNHTYVLDSEGLQVLLTSPHAAPGGVVLAQGRVLYMAPHPDGSGRLLVVVGVQAWRSPILFR